MRCNSCSRTWACALCALCRLYQPDTGGDKTPGNNRSHSPPATSTSTSTSSSTATVISTPVAVETLPAGQNVDIQVEKQRPDATIHLLYNGGEGEMFVQNIMMRVTRSDGQVEEQYLNDGARKPRRGDELVMAGTGAVTRLLFSSPAQEKPTGSLINRLCCPITKISIHFFEILPCLVCFPDLFCIPLRYKTENHNNEPV